MSQRDEIMGFYDSYVLICCILHGVKWLITIIFVPLLSGEILP